MYKEWTYKQLKYLEGPPDPPQKRKLSLEQNKINQTKGLESKIYNLAEGRTHSVFYP